MNNGQLLNNLLGITSTNSAANKAAANSARLESGEKFQQAFEQARPEVAARKPVARKSSSDHEAQDAARPPAKPVAQRHSHADTKSETHARARTSAADASDKPKSAVADSSNPAPEQSSTQVTTSQDKTPVDATTDDASLIVDPALVIVGQPNELLAAEEGLLVPDAALLPTEDSAAETTTETLLTLDSAQLLPDLGLTPLAGAAAGETATTTTTNPTLLSQVAALASGQTLTVQGGISTDEGDSPALDATAEGELSADVSGSDNPDFLLLNSKVLLHKLTEANMAASVQAEGAPLADAAKPAAAVESLLRLADSQSPAARAFVVQTGVPVAVGSPQWTQAVGDKVLWLAAQNVSAAEIRLDPPELGPMQVKVSVNQDQASVTFTSPHPAVREVLDQQLNRLREMFSEQGLNLVNVDVSDKSFAQQDREQKESGKNANAELDEENLEPVGISQAVSLRLVDHYA